VSDAFKLLLGYAAGSGSPGPILPGQLSGWHRLRLGVLILGMWAAICDSLAVFCYRVCFTYVELLKSVYGRGFVSPLRAFVLQLGSLEKQAVS